MAGRSKKSQLPGADAVERLVLAVGAGTPDEVPVWKNELGASVKLTKASFMAKAAVTGDDTNNMTLTVRNKGSAGTGTTSMASKQFVTGQNIAAFASAELTLTSTEADLVVDDGEHVSLDKDEAGAGLALPAGVLVLQFEYV